MKMKSVLKFVKNNAVAVIAFFAALVTMFIVPPSESYFGYIDFPVIVLLFCLMAAVAGLRSLGVFDAISGALLSKTSSARLIAFILMNLCFFLSMLVTNDVALITFVPLTLGLYQGTSAYSQLIMTIVIETAAANLGSMLTPIGNPQNLFLYSHYSMDIGAFMTAVALPAALGYVLLCASVLLVKKTEVAKPVDKPVVKAGPRFWLYTAVFVLSVLSVAGIVSYIVCLIVAVTVMCIADYMLFTKIDYSLLLTFVFFFIFVGNLSSIDAVESFVRELLSGKELVVSALLSQVISNVPAAAMLADFTDNAAELLQGVNIGGLGTPVASLASLISFRYYSASEGAKKGRYMAMFLCVNFAMLAILLGAAVFVF